MVSIGITFCDSDYQNYNKLTLQIKERVHVPYELIIIDNTEGNKLGNKATFAFGYNAFQFAARYKIIKLAKGEYIWFVDGDDEVLGLNNNFETADIIAFSVEDKTKDRLSDFLYTSNFDFNFIQFTIRGALWNKLISKDLYNDIDDYVKKPLLKVVSLEDTFYIAFALKNAKTVRTCSQFIYKHNPGLSNTYGLSLEGYKTLMTGFEQIIDLFGDIGCSKVEYKKHQLHYYTRLIWEEINLPVLEQLMKTFPYKKYWKEYIVHFISECKTNEDYQSVRQLFINYFGLSELPKKWYETTDEHGNIKRVYYEISPPIRSHITEIDTTK